MNSLSSVARRFVGGGIIATFLLGAAAAPNAGGQSPQDRLFQNITAPSPRMLVLMVDGKSMSSSDAQRVIMGSIDWIDTVTDPTAVVTGGDKVTVWSDFTTDRAALRTVLRSEAFLQAILEPNAGPQPIRFGGNSPAQNPDTTTAAGAQPAEERMRSIGTVCEAMSTIPSRKAIIYFSNGLRRSDDQGSATSLRAAVSACNRAGVTINPIDARGLMAAVLAPKQ